MIIQYAKDTFDVLFKRDEKKFDLIQDKYSFSFILSYYAALIIIPIILLALIFATVISIFGLGFNIGVGLISFFGVLFGILFALLLGNLLYHLVIIGVQHISLKIFKGVETFKQTLTTFLIIGTPFMLINLGLSIISTIISLIPLVGFILSMPITLIQLALIVWTIVIQGIFYSKKHKIGIEKGIISAFIPVLTFILLGILAIIVGVIILFIGVGI